MGTSINKVGDIDCGVIEKLCSLYVQTSISPTPLDLRIVINNNSKVFGEMPKDIPLAREHDHAIHLQPGSVPPKLRPYRYPYAYKSEIECMIHEMLEANIIQPSHLVISLHQWYWLQKNMAQGICVQIIDNSTK
jgi:hypothetical protein